MRSMDIMGINHSVGSLSITQSKRVERPVVACPAGSAPARRRSRACAVLCPRAVQRVVVGAAWLLIALCAMQGAAVTPAQAQGRSDLDDVDVDGTAYYRFVRSGEVQIEVMALGSVRSPGLYAVGLGMTLDQLLGLAGGAVNARRSSAERVRTVVRLYRQEEAGRALIYEEPMEHVLAGTGQYPALQSGDTLVLEQIVRQRWFTLDRTVRLLSTAATFTLLILRIRDITN